MNPAAGCTVQRQSDTLIAALRTRVADQSSDACQYFRIIAEGCSLLRLFRSLSTTFYPVSSLPPPSHSTTSFFFYVVAPAASSLHAKPNECRQEKAKRRRAGSGFLKRPDDALMRPGLCGWTEATDFARDRRIRGVQTEVLRTSLGSPRRSLVSCWDLPVFN